MRDDWILDVLTDLRGFAEQKGMDATAEILTDACLLAAADLRKAEQVRRQEMMEVDGNRTGKLSGVHPGR